MPGIGTWREAKFPLSLFDRDEGGDFNPHGFPRYADAIAAESNYFFNSPFAHFSRGFGLGLYQWEASTQT